MTPEEVAALKDGHAELQRRVDTIDRKLDANTAATQRVEANTAELMDWLRSFQGAAKVFNLVGSLAKPLGFIAMAVGACLSAWYAFIHKA